MKPPGPFWKAVYNCTAEFYVDVESICVGAELRQLVCCCSSVTRMVVDLSPPPDAYAERFLGVLQASLQIHTLLLAQRRLELR